ncbi:MAG: ATP-binding cassette domain-containing protein [Dehalococcoidales bacterium]|nr:ATP-binding cassette domain-containing protein [Dehalococcoidales bacterium]
MDTDVVPEIRDDRYAIHVQGLTRVFGDLIAVDGIDLNIKKGELFALLGTNGAGKTTTIKMLCCLLKPTDGSASVMGYDINREQYQIKEIIGVSPQETTISEHLNAWEHLQLIGKIHGVNSAEINERSALLLETMGLTERAKDQVRKYSGGMMRRLSIIMALVHDPDVVFLDEPTLGLDPQARHAIWDYLEQFKGEKTILLTTHYLDEADYLSDRLAIMDEGKIVAQGTSTELKTNMLGKHTMIVYAWNLTQKVISEMTAKYEEVTVTDGTMEITHPELDFKEVVDSLHSAGATIRSAYVREPSLDDVFLNITGKEIRE